MQVKATNLTHHFATGCILFSFCRIERAQRNAGSLYRSTVRRVEDKGSAEPNIRGVKDLAPHRAIGGGEVSKGVF
jgi:hypothetical protein